MKRFFAAALAVVLVACSTNTELTITPEGIGPVKIGMNIADLPQSVEGLYDSVEVVVTEGYYDEFEGEDVPSSETYYFVLGGENVFNVTPYEGVIDAITVTGASFSYAGVHPGMSCRDALATEATLSAMGCFASCEFYACFLNGEAPIHILFDYDSFSEEGYAKLYDMPFYEGWYELNFEPSDFNEDATIREIVIM